MYKKRDLTAVILGVLMAIILGPLIVFAAARFKPGETTNPNCAPTDPDCDVESQGIPGVYVVPDIAARDLLTSTAKVGDHVIVSNLGESFIFTQTGSWDEFSKILPTVRIVDTIAARDAIMGASNGDIAIVNSTNQTYVYDSTLGWQEFSIAHLADDYVVADITELNNLTGLQAGDTAVVTSLNKSYVRTRQGTWQELLSPPQVVSIKHTYVVADDAARDALTNLEPGDVAVVTSTSTTYIYTQDSAWQQLLAPQAGVVSVNGKAGVVNLNSQDVPEGSSNFYYTDTRARNAISGSAPLSYNSVSGVLQFLFESPLTLNGLNLGLDASQINLSSLGGTLPVAKGGTGQSSYTDGQLLIGDSSGGSLVKANLIAGNGINVTNSHGSITLANNIPVYQATDTVDATTTSLTFTRATNMVLTPGAGDYLVWFSSSMGDSNAGKIVYAAIFKNGVEIQASETRYLVSGANGVTPVSLTAYVPNLSASDTIDVEWKVSANTGTMHQRTLIMQRLR